jgi:hypothetical protein
MKKHKEIIKGCLAIPASFHPPSVGITFSKKDVFNQRYIVVQHEKNQIIFDIKGKRRVSFFGKNYLIEKNRIGGSVDGDFTSDDRVSFEAFQSKGSKNYMYFPDSIKIFLIPNEGEVKEFNSKVNWITKMECKPPGGPVHIEN